MATYRRRFLSKENQAEVEAVTNSQTPEDLQTALLNPYSKASQIQRNLELGRLEHHVYIERIIELAATQQLKVEEHERKAILQQQILAQLEKEKRFNEEYAKHFKQAMQEAEQNKPITATVAQLTATEWQQKIQKDREEITATENKIENLKEEISTIKEQKELLQEAWEDLRREEITQYTADLREQNIQFVTATGATVDPQSEEGQKIINDIYAASPYELAEKYTSIWAQIKKVYEMEMSQGSPIKALAADIMTEKEIPPTPSIEPAEKDSAIPAASDTVTTEKEVSAEEATPPETEADKKTNELPAEPTQEDMLLTNISLQQVGLLAALGPGVGGEALLNLLKGNKEALNLLEISNQKAEQKLQSRYAAEADKNPGLAAAYKEYRHVANKSKLLGFAAHLVAKEAKAVAAVTYEKEKLAAQQLKLAQDIKGSQQSAKPAPEK